MQRPHPVEEVECARLRVLHDLVLVRAVEQPRHLLEVLLAPLLAADEGSKLVLSSLYQ